MQWNRCVAFRSLVPAIDVVMASDDFRNRKDRLDGSTESFEVTVAELERRRVRPSCRIELPPKLLWRRRGSCPREVAENSRVLESIAACESIPLIGKRNTAVRREKPTTSASFRASRSRFKPTPSSSDNSTRFARSETSPTTNEPDQSRQRKPKR